MKSAVKGCRAGLGVDWADLERCFFPWQAPRIRKSARHACWFEALRSPLETQRGRVLQCTLPLGSCGELSWLGGSFPLLDTRHRIQNLTNYLKIFLPPRARPAPVGGGSLVVWVLFGWLPWRAGNPLRGRMETKKRVPESMPTSEAVARACLIRMGERARMGALCLMESDKAGVVP